MSNRPSRSGLALLAGTKVSTKRTLLVLLLALLIAVTLVFAIVGPTLNTTDTLADGGSSTVVAWWSFDGGSPYDAGGAFRAGPSWS